MHHGIVVREAAVDDARGIAEVHVASWRAGYRGLLPRRMLDALDVDERTASWAHILAGHTAIRGSRTLVALRDAIVVGFASFGPARSERDPPSDARAEVYALYVPPIHWGIGAGRVLMDVVFGELRRQGHAAVLLWVLRGNMRARRFYELTGWTRDGAERASEAALGVPSVRYRREL